jgi:hypothetical protein
VTYLQNFSVVAVLRSIVVVTEHVLSLQISLSVSDLLVVAASQAHVFESLLVDREEANSGTHFRGHVGDGGTIGDRQLSNTRAVEFDELVNDPTRCKLDRSDSKDLELLGDRH